MLVILEEALPVGPRELAGPLAKTLRRVRYDVLGALKQNPYVLFTDLDKEAAAAGAQCLADAGVRAAAVSAGRLPPQAKVFTVHNADAEEDSLAVQTDLAGKMRRVPWNGIEVISAASCSETYTPGGITGCSVEDSIEAAQRAHLGAGFGGYQLRAPEIPRPQAKTDTYAVLCIMPRGADIEVRFRADQFNYDYLGERLVPDSEKNFRTLVADVLERAGGAVVNAWARELAEGGKAPPVLEKHRLAAYNRWLRLRARTGL